MQVDLSVWEQGRGSKYPIALLRPTEAEPPFNRLKFEYPEDEDNFGFAIVRLGSGVVVALVSDPTSPTPGTGLYGVGKDESRSILREARKAFNLDESDVLWVSGETPQS
ncbi:hypothetical protein JCM4914_22900 [Streptomyces platensis subsp. malvinus]